MPANMLMAVALAFALAAPAAAEPPGPVLVQDQGHRLEFSLPGPYWEHRTRAELVGGASGGCAGPRVPEELLHAAWHKDALAPVWVLEGGRRFLVRNQGDLEAVCDATVAALMQQAGPGAVQRGREYSKVGGVIVHRFSFSAPLRSGGGCTAAGGAPGQPASVRYIVTDCFLRPKGEDALNMQLRCFVAEEQYESLRPEIEFIVGSLRYTGDTEPEFFVPDAPQEKLLTAAQVTQAIGGKRQFPYGLLIAGMVLLTWAMLRRKRPRSVA